MTKIKKVKDRGTSIREDEVTPPQWAGDSFREYQKKRMSSLPKDTKIIRGRGTGSVKVGEYPEPPEKPSTKGYTVITGRGTGKRKLE